MAALRTKLDFIVTVNIMDMVSTPGLEAGSKGETTVG